MYDKNIKLIDGMFRKKKYFVKILNKLFLKCILVNS